MSKIKEQTVRLINIYANHFLYHRVRAHFQRTFKQKMNNMEGSAIASIPECQVSPLIVLGMHRSGTTMMSRLLTHEGMYMGWLRGFDTDESLFFQSANRAMLSLTDSSWDNPETFTKAWQDEAFIDQLSGIAYNYCEKPAKTVTYRGLNGRRGRSFFAQRAMWGWKDPRTCITLPIWLQLFPEAKVLFMHRNGLDVANSLFVRNKKYVNNNAYSERCSDLQGAFQLWEIYNKQCLSSIAQLDPLNLLQIAYEDLLSSPEEIMPKVFDFINLNPSEQRLKKMIASIDSKRGYAFLADPTLTSFYTEVKDRPMMKSLGYSDIPVP